MRLTQNLEQIVLVSGANAAALAQRMGRTFTDAEAARAEILIREAALLIARRVNLTYEAPELVRAALLQTVSFYLTVVDGQITSETISVDDATHTVRRSTPTAGVDAAGMVVPPTVWELFRLSDNVGSTMPYGMGVTYFGGRRSW